MLIHSNYLSQKDIEICLTFDLTSLGDAVPAENVGELHAALVGGYSDGEARTAA